MTSRIHPSAQIDPRAELGESVEVGPYSIIGPGVRIGDRTRLMSHVVVSGHTTLGAGNVVHPFAVIGGEPQVRKMASVGTATPRPALLIGDDNVIREHVTISVASTDMPTKLGSSNLLMAGCHVAHDVVLGSHCVVANGVQLAGHVVVEDWVTFGGVAGVAQHRHIGQSAFVAAGAMCERDVPPFVIVQGDRARVRALNVVGLERRGVPLESRKRLKEVFAAAFVRRTSPLAVALEGLDRSDEFVAAFVAALLRT